MGFLLSGHSQSQSGAVPAAHAYRSCAKQGYYQTIFNPLFPQGKPIIFSKGVLLSAKKSYFNSNTGPSPFEIGAPHFTFGPPVAA